MSREHKVISLPDRFEPLFWAEADGRTYIIQEIKRRYEALKSDANVNSVQKDLLAQRAIFVAIQLETMERVACEKGVIEAGVYAQMTNTLMGLLKALGLEKVPKSVSTDLKAYVRARRAKS